VDDLLYFFVYKQILSAIQPTQND